MKRWTHHQIVIMIIIIMDLHPHHPPVPVTIDPQEEEGEDQQERDLRLEEGPVHHPVFITIMMIMINRF